MTGKNEMLFDYGRSRERFSRIGAGVTAEMA